MTWTPAASAALTEWCRENDIEALGFWTLREFIEELAKSTGAKMVTEQHVAARCKE